MKVTAKRRFTEHFDQGRGLTLKPDHPAVVEGRTLFVRSRRPGHGNGQKVLKSGHNQRKLGDRVTKGRWKNFKVYSLTLEERATCPRSCSLWKECYGNSTPFAHRFEAGPELEARLDVELRALAASGPFVVRLHILGDFFDVEYVRSWERWLSEIPELHVFGYTAWQPSSLIGAEIGRVRGNWDRFAVRYSGIEAVTEGSPDTGGDTKMIVCPAQTEASDCCGTCTLCWAARPEEVTIVFKRH